MRRRYSSSSGETAKVYSSSLLSPFFLFIVDSQHKANLVALCIDRTGPFAGMAVYDPRCQRHITFCFVGPLSPPNLCLRHLCWSALPSMYSGVVAEGGTVSSSLGQPHRRGHGGRRSIRGHNLVVSVLNNAMRTKMYHRWNYCPKSVVVPSLQETAKIKRPSPNMLLTTIAHGFTSTPAPMMNRSVRGVLLL